VTAQAQTLEIASPTGKISPTSELESTIAPFIADKDVLDIGSINHVFLSKNRKRGWMFDFLLSQAAAVQGVDIELDQVERANAAGYPIVHGDAETYLAGRQYDDVLATDLIEHLSNAALFLAAARKNLKPGGQLVLSTPNAFCFRELFYVYSRWTNDPPFHAQHVCYYTPTTLKALAARYGFRESGVFYANVRYERITWVQRQLLAFGRMISKLTPRFSQTLIMVFDAE
jgi:2-polyprenyl-3-methyl-5-hydroxy-6-metoxy-1,4-benzoquinol methylase